MLKSLLFVALAATSALGITSCETVGALKVAKDAMEGKPLISDTDIPQKRPNTGHIPDDSPSRGFLQWKAD